MKALIVAAAAVVAYFMVERLALAGLAKAAIVGAAAALTYTLWTFAARRIQHAKSGGRRDEQ